MGSTKKFSKSLNTIISIISIPIPSNWNKPTSTTKHNPNSNSFYRISYIARLFGFFPVSNLSWNSCDANKLQFKLCSWPVLYTLIFNFIMFLFGLEPTIGFIKYYKHTMLVIPTDSFALHVFFVVYFLFKVILHVIAILIAPRIILILQDLQNYDHKFQVVFATKLLNINILIYGISTIIKILAGLYSYYPSFYKYLQSSYNSEDVRLICLQICPSPIVVTILANFGQVITELATLFSHYPLILIIYSLRDRITSLGLEIDLCLEGLNARNDDYELVQEITNQLSNIGTKFLHLRQLCDKLNYLAREQVLGIIASTILILVTVSYSLAFTAAKETLLPTEVITLIVVTCLVVTRLLNLINLGEKLEYSVENLRLSCKKHTNLPNNLILHNKITHLQFIIVITELSLNVWNFCKLNRSLLISTLSPIVTFVVVLAQFRAADTQVVSNMHLNS